MVCLSILQLCRFVLSLFVPRFFLVSMPRDERLRFVSLSLREHAYLNILKILSPKNENFQMKNSYILHISDENIDCGYSLEPPLRGGSNEYPQSMLLSRNKKNNVYPCKPQFYYNKVGFKGVTIIQTCFRDVVAFPRYPHLYVYNSCWLQPALKLLFVVRISLVCCGMLSY